MLTRIDHVGIACHDLEQQIAIYETTFGLTVAHRETNTEQGVHEVMMRVADAPASTSYVQLLEPVHPDTPVGKFLARRGEGVHHVAYGVTDLRAAMEAVRANGVRLVDERPRRGTMGSAITFLHPKDVGGVLTELVQTGGAATLICGAAGANAGDDAAGERDRDRDGTGGGAGRAGA
jgi:methylmalonyl-CoA/ethylmalonyl-CoA epimerase